MDNPLTPQQFGEGIVAPLRSYWQAMVNKGFAEQQMASDANKQAREERRLQAQAQAEAERENRRNEIAQSKLDLAKQQRADALAQDHIKSIMGTVRGLRKEDTVGLRSTVEKLYPQYLDVFDANAGLDLDLSKNPKMYRDLDEAVLSGNPTLTEQVGKRLGLSPDVIKTYKTAATNQANLKKELADANRSPEKPTDRKYTYVTFTNEAGQVQTLPMDELLNERNSLIDQIGRVSNPLPVWTDRLNAINKAITDHINKTTPQTAGGSSQTTTGGKDKSVTDLINKALSR